MTDKQIAIHVTSRHADTPRVHWTWTPEEAVQPGAPEYYASYAHLEIGGFELAVKLGDMELLGNLLLTEAANRRDALARARGAVRAVA